MQHHDVLLGLFGSYAQAYEDKLEEIKTAIGQLSAQLEEV
jgi:hypothetical protein